MTTENQARFADGDSPCVLEWGAVSLPVGDPSRVTELKVCPTLWGAIAEGALCGFDWRVYPLAEVVSRAENQAPEGGPEPEPAAWLVTWKGEKHEYVHAHASELPAVDQARIMGGKCEPLYRAALAAQPQAAPAALSEAHRQELIMLRSRVRTQRDELAKLKKAAPAPAEGAGHAAVMRQALEALEWTDGGHKERAAIAALRTALETLEAAPRVVEHVLPFSNVCNCTQCESARAAKSAMATLRSALSQ